MRWTCLQETSETCFNYLTSTLYSCKLSLSFVFIGNTNSSVTRAGKDTLSISYKDISILLRKNHSFFGSTKKVPILKIFDRNDFLNSFYYYLDNSTCVILTNLYETKTNERAMKFQVSGHPVLVESVCKARRKERRSVICPQAFLQLLEKHSVTQRLHHEANITAQAESRSDQFLCTSLFLTSFLKTKI